MLWMKKYEKNLSVDRANNLAKSVYTDLPLSDRVRLTSISDNNMITYATAQKGSGIAQLVERLHRDRKGAGSSLTGASLGLLPGLTVAGHSP